MALILVVDDEEYMLEVLKSLLQSESYEVLTALDGEKALKLVNSVDIDLVITDMRMQPMNGLEVLRSVKEGHPATPVIMITAYASMKTEQEAMQMGASAYLSKPFDIDEVIETVKKALAPPSPPPAQ